jgi:alpha-D-xyloside xylohydrolase
VTPVLYSSRGYALFAAANPEAMFNLNSTGDGVHRYRRAGQSVTLRIALGEDWKELMDRRAAVDGPYRAVPDWAWGPWISRNSYETQAEAEEAIAGMLERDIPVSVIVQEAWKGSSEAGAFNSFSEDRWPDVEGYLAMCREHDIRNVLWQVPILHPSSPHYKVGKEKGYFVKKPDGTISHRKAWLAGFANLDFTNPDAVAFWQDLLRPVVRMGAYGFKADDGEDIKPDDVFFDGRRGWDMHNEYSTLYNRALTELFDQEGVAGMLWARSGSLGIEQAPALWAGDQYATWQQMKSLIPAGLSSSMSGMPFWGHDIGGYIGNPSPELYMRWVQLGTFSPFMQYHGIKPREPWFFGPQAERAYSKMAHMRMNLRPTLKALGEEAARTGYPIMRPMAFEFPSDPRFPQLDTQYMLGPDLLVAPIVEEDATGRRVLFPEGRWQHMLYPVVYEGPAEYEVPLHLETAPVFVREGARLAVEMEEGATWGEWEKGVPEREVAYPPSRAHVANLQADLWGDVLTRRAQVAFDVPAGLEGPLRLMWMLEDGSQRGVIKLKPSEDGRVQVNIGEALEGVVNGSRQKFRIQQAGVDGERQTLFEGAVRWRSPLVVSAEPEGSRFVREGERGVFLHIHNRSPRPVETEVIAETESSAAVLPAEKRVTVPAGETAKVRFILRADPANRVGDIPVDFDVIAQDRLLGRTHVRFTRPLRWIVAGPFPTGERKGYGTPYPPEWIVDEDVQFETESGPVKWWALDADHTVRNNGINFIEAFGRLDHRVGYAFTRVHSDRPRDAELRFGSDDTLTVWLNGEKVYSVETYRDIAWDQEVVPVRLKRGENTIRVKVAQDRNAWRLMMHITAPGGTPLDGLTDAFSDHHAFDPMRVVDGPRVPLPRPVQWQVAGPVSFDRDQAWPTGRYDGLARDANWPPEREGLTWHAAADLSNYAGVVDLNELLGRELYVDAYAAASVRVDKPTLAEFRVGSDDGITLWLNGTPVLEVDEWRGYEPDENRVRAMLKAGENRLFARIRQGTGNWKFSVNLWDVSRKPYRPIQVETE